MNNLETKQERYNVLVSSILTNKASVGKGLWEMGLALKKIKAEELYLLEFRDFKEFLEKKVELSMRTAYRCISITEESDLRDFMKWGLYKLEIINREFPKETEVKSKKEFIREGSAEFGKSVEPQIQDFKLDKGIPEIARFKSQAGIKEQDTQETELKLIRQYSKIEAFLASLIESLANWLAEGKKHTENEEIAGLVEKAEDLQRRLK